MAVHFIDTSVLCNIVPVPGRDRDRVETLSELERYLQARDVLILPVTSVVETGNFIAQMDDGRQRREAADKLGSPASAGHRRTSPIHVP
jgi:hypothetical protein